MYVVIFVYIITLLTNFSDAIHMTMQIDQLLTLPSSIVFFLSYTDLQYFTTWKKLCVYN